MAGRTVSPSALGAETCRAETVRFRIDGCACIVTPDTGFADRRADQLGAFVLNGRSYRVTLDPGDRPAPLPSCLTPRELEIAMLVASGVDSKSIARRLRISFHTVRVHICRIYAKLGLHKQTELAAWVCRQVGQDAAAPVR